VRGISAAHAGRVTRAKAYAEGGLLVICCVCVQLLKRARDPLHFPPGNQMPLASNRKGVHASPSPKHRRVRELILQQYSYQISSTSLVLASWQSTGWVESMLLGKRHAVPHLKTVVQLPGAQSVGGGAVMDSSITLRLPIRHRCITRRGDLVNHKLLSINCPIESSHLSSSVRRLQTVSLHGHSLLCIASPDL
jgi:hypothetical protein